MKQFICKRGWVRHSVGAVIGEWEWRKLPQDVQERHFEVYEPKVEVVPEPVQTFEKDLAENLEKAGIKAEFKHKVKNGKTELDATFKFNEDE